MARIARTLLICLQITVLAAHLPAQNAAQDWKQFRQFYPYHLQVVAISQPDAEGRRTLIVSEPPPQLTIEKFRMIDPASLQHLSSAQHGIGVNGWVRDIVVQLPPMDEAKLSELIDNLHRSIFGTSYKAYAVPIPDASASVPRIDLDLHVTSAELNKWLVGTKPDVPGDPWTIGRILLLCGLISVSGWLLVMNAKRKRILRVVAIIAIAAPIISALIPDRGTTSDAVRLKPITGGDAVVLRTVLDKQKAGVFLSAEPGFVVWSFPRNASLDSYRIEAREFAVDSDLLIGAIGSDNQVAIIGRERVSPIALLPPLRIETLFQLAAANTKELAQSYERKFVFAGRFTKTDDWAPIYLSDELIDTEYGSLLNITDQMLKSWSQHGDVKYVNFNYSAPPDYPFPKPITEQYQVRQLTFNWNTKGAGYVSTAGPYEVFAMNRLGALPVDYLAGTSEDMQKAEDVAYQYYRGLSDPNLVRVVEYAGMYQIFRHFHVTAQAPLEHHAQIVDSLKPMAEYVIKEITSVTDEQLDRVSAESQNEEDKKEVETVRQVRDQLLAFQQSADKELQETLLAALSDPVVFRSLMPKANSDQSTREIIELTSGVAKARSIMSGTSSNLNAIAQAAYREASERKDNTWIKTPTIVISRAQGQLVGGVGGHNLSSAVTELRADTQLSAGSVRVAAAEDGTKVVYYNPADSDRVPEIVRSAGRYGEKEPAELENVLNGEMKTAQAVNRSVTEMLGYTDTFKPAEMRGLQSAHLGSGGESTGWRPTDGVVPPENQNIRIAFEPRKGPTDKIGSVVVIRNQDGSYLVVHGPNQTIRAQDLPSAIDATIACVRSDESEVVNIHLSGIEAKQAKGFVRTAELNMEPETTKRISASIEETLSPEDLERLAKEDFDFSRAEVKNVSEIKVTPEGRAVDVDLDIPAKSSARPSLLVRIRMWLDNTFQMTQDFALLVAQKFQAILGDPNPLVSAQRVLKDLQSVHPGIKHVEIRLQHESKDVLLVLRRSPIRISAEAGQPA